MGADIIHPGASLIASSRDSQGEPFLTVAIPHYKHPRHLEIVLASLFAQTFEDFEILVSDDCSPDDSAETIPPVLAESKCSFRYFLQSSNLGYDGNVRFCLRAARGRYIFLLGNDDALSEPATLENVAGMLRSLGLPQIAFTNYEDWSLGEVNRRALTTAVLGSGPGAAVTNFRSFSFVSGLIYERSAAARYETDRWDQSIYYQIYLACKILATGGRLATLDLSAVQKDVRIGDRTVVNYVSKWSNEKWSFQSRHTGLDSVIRVTANAVLSEIPAPEHSRTLRKIVAKVLVSSYPFWLFEYRKVSNWSFAVGIARGMWPGKLLAEYRIGFVDRIYLYLLYATVTVAGLIIPKTFFGMFGSKVAGLIRGLQQSKPLKISP